MCVLLYGVNGCVYVGCEVCLYNLKICVIVIMKLKCVFMCRCIGCICKCMCRCEEVFVYMSRGSSLKYNIVGNACVSLCMYIIVCRLFFFL